MLTTSASQADNARACLRKWAWDWILPKEGSPSPEAALGKEIHSLGEAYSNSGHMPPDTEAGKILRSGLPFMPKALVGRCEGEFQLTVSGLHYKGFIDWQGRAGDLPGTPPELADIPAAMDYKSVRDLQARRMLKGPGEFLNDPQALLYALKLLLQFGTDRVYLRWLYLKREGAQRKAVPQDVVLSRQEVSLAFGRIVHPISYNLVQIRSKGKIDPLSLDPNPARCMAYGPKWPCPHIERCNLSAADKLRWTRLEEIDMSFMDELKAEVAKMGNGSAPTTGGINPPKMVEAAQEQDEEAALAAQLEAVKIRKANEARLAREEAEMAKASKPPASTDPSDAEALAALKTLDRWIHVSRRG